MTKLFATGATGYIGGDALTAIVAAHPEYEITALARSSEDKAAAINQAFPSVRVVIGSLDDTELLVREAAKADIVCNWADCNHLSSTRALLDGLSQHSPSSPGYLIHVSATNIQTINQALGSIPLGDTDEKIYDDWDGISEVIGLPDSAPHREVERLILEPKDSNVRTAIICPSLVYGEGRGPVNTRSSAIARLVRATIAKGHGIFLRMGLNHWGAVHVKDLSCLFQLLIEAAASRDEKLMWNDALAKRGYYFAHSEDLEWAEVAGLITRCAFKRGLIQREFSKSLTYEESEAIWPLGVSLWGSNARIIPTRASKLLGWKPRERPLKEEISRTCNAEARSVIGWQGL
ncbi:nucleoside-diphosphate-sugar epimerase [Aspergillus parasiticus]|uniref:Nucleoside-diphosphate-sugar epimerase n=1 Tax=Aspergillus parasiticus TaxID=5067 RepID=A0A5N6DTQ4_ASPPA|nr:nucleoside-diphosphate-sugar epimerase [Aspergillus parasiticus]